VEPGTVVDSRYRIIEPLGSGGMGIVYRAQHVHIRREVALKLLHPAMGRYQQIGERFEREAYAIGKLDQPNCVTVQDFGQLEDSSLYLAMELVRGASLDELIDPAAPMPYPRVFHIARHVLAGLSHAHAAGIVHRDIKPENIILTERTNDPDFAKILDFGLAKLLGDNDEKELTQAGTSFGTPTYIAPEQAVGDPLDGRADLYALSIVMYELLSGSPPFEAKDKLSVLAMHTGQPVPPLPPRLGVPPAVEAVIRKGLAKRADDRWADADEYIAALDRALAQPNAAPPATVTATTTTTTTAATPAPPRRRWPIAAAIAGVLGAIALAAVLLSGSGTSDTAAHAAELLAIGDSTGAIEYLEAADIDDDAGALLQLAHAYGETKRHSKALPTYVAALRLRPSLASDAKLRTYVVPLASSKKMSVRVLARQLAEGAGALDEVDLLASYTLDLAQSKRCSDRKTAIPKLRALGDKRAIPALEAARHKKGGVRFDRKNLNACLTADADEAVRYLKSL
jgi:tetratricopeptide (TPR) repeat protein